MQKTALARSLFFIHAKQTRAERVGYAEIGFVEQVNYEHKKRNNKRLLRSNR